MLYKYDGEFWKKKGSYKTLLDKDIHKVLLDLGISTDDMSKLMIDLKKAASPKEEIVLGYDEIQEILLKHMDNLPLMLHTGSNRSAPLEYYLLTDMRRCREVSYLLNIKAEEPKKIARDLQNTMTINTEELCEDFTNWETAVTADLLEAGIEPKKLKDVFCDTLELMQRRSKCSHKYIDEIIPASRDPKTYCLKFLDDSKYVDGPTPNCDEFMDRIVRGSQSLEASEIFKAFVWSILEPGNVGRACMWLHGTQGKDGKSTFLTQLSKTIGEDCCVSINQDSYRDKFFFSAIVRKILVGYADNKNPRLISDGKIHNLLGRDSVSIEYKHRNPFSAVITAKLMVMANVAPELTRVDHELTRVIYLRVAQASEEVVTHGDSSYSEKIYKEMPHFLYKCKQAFQKYCKRNADIELTYELKALRNSCISDSAYYIDNFLDETFVFREDLSTDLLELMEEVAKFVKKSCGKHTTWNKQFLVKDVYDNIEYGHRSKVWVEGDRKIPGSKVIYHGIGIKEKVEAERKKKKPKESPKSLHKKAKKEELNEFGFIKGGAIEKAMQEFNQKKATDLI